MKIRVRVACIRDHADGVKEVVLGGPKPATQKDKADREGIESMTVAFRTKDASNLVGYEVGDEFYVTIGERTRKVKPVKPA